MNKISIALLAAAFAMGVADASAQCVWDANQLDYVKHHIDNVYYQPAYKALIEQADSMLTLEPLSVMMKPKAAPSGDMHDYLSQARYAWPDPSKPDGKPYIHRDGVSNPEIELLDRMPFGATADRVKTLSLAWYLSGDERYAQKATELVDVWFLDKATLMNPNLEYAQVVPGTNGDKGRCYGLIDTYSLIGMLDGVALLGQSKSFKPAQAKKLRQWVSRLLDWMLTSPQGIEESQAGNNHSLAYDAQVAAFAMYCGRTDVARKVLEAVPQQRIALQIEPDGKQPHELGRTLAFHYSQYNLSHLLDLAMMGQKLGIDISGDPEGPSLHKALAYLAQYAGKPQQEWPYQQISGWEQSQQELCRDLYRAARYVGDADGWLMSAYRGARIDAPTHQFRLLWVRPTLTDEAFAAASTQLRYAIACADSARRSPDNRLRGATIPRSIKPDGSLVMVHPHDWCSGFFAGTLWSMYEYTHEPYWREQAISWTWPVEESKYHTGTHDLGFMIGDSFGRAWKLTGEKSYADVVVRAAESLSTRFNPTVGCIKSWDHNGDVWRYPVIVDNMMNLEMLFEASALTGDDKYRDIAIKHADTTIKHHFRDDYSSFHVVDYDPDNGEVRGRCTHQGWSDDSFWSRGQSWGLYGYTLCYRYTGDERYLAQARGIADFLLSLPNMPTDGIPYWDMKAPGTDIADNAEVPRDASSAAIMASALYELAQYVDDGTPYVEAADKMLASLHSGYEAPAGTNYGFLLLHSTGHHPGGSEIDVPLNYADYYYLEALLRRSQLD